LGNYNPAKHLLIPNVNGTFLGCIEFTPTWAEDFDSFILICRCNDLISGHDWAGLKIEYRKIYSFNSHFREYDGLNKDKVPVQTHLFHAKLVKVVCAQIIRPQCDVRTTLKLEIRDR
jgi:hypothetical protein